MKDMTISKAADQAGVGVETVRYYERKGLIDQPPTPAFGGYRVYPEETVERIRLIRQARELDFSLDEIRKLLSLRNDSLSDCADVLERAQARLEEVRIEIGRLDYIRSVLERLIAACPGQGDLDACSILEAMDGGNTSVSDRPPGKQRKKS